MLTVLLFCIRYDPLTQSNSILFDQARHVCEGLDVVKLRQTTNASQRDLLYQAAETARETGARSVGLYYYKHCLDLLDAKPWDSTAEDASYGETLALYTKAAEAYWYMGRFEECSACLEEIFEHARDYADKAPAAIIRSRMYAQQSNSRKAFLSLQDALIGLGVEIPESSWEECDDEFQRLFDPLVQTLQDELEPASNINIDRDLATLGALMVELLSAAFWTDALLFYQATLKLMDIYLQKGIFPHVGWYVKLGRTCDLYVVANCRLVSTSVPIGIYKCPNYPQR